MNEEGGAGGALHVGLLATLRGLKAANAPPPLLGPFGGAALGNAGVNEEDPGGGRAGREGCGCGVFEVDLRPGGGC